MTALVDKREVRRTMVVKKVTYEVAPGSCYCRYVVHEFANCGHLVQLAENHRIRQVGMVTIPYMRVTGCGFLIVRFHE
jgi:hypothetical protein